MAATEYVILVDTTDQPIGIAEKLAAHQQELCHRAFSIFVMRPPTLDANEPEILLQQRALGKYHSPGLWTNTCCSHPRPGEEVIAAGERRLAYEMGITITLKSLGSFHYVAHFDNGLTENEVDHVLIGHVSPEYTFTVNRDEVAAYRWITPSQLRQELQSHPALFTPWLLKALDFGAIGVRC